MPGLERTFEESDAYKYGFAIGIPTRGTIDIRFMIHMHNLSLVLPTGLTWKYVYCRGYPVDVARESIVEACIEHKVKNLFFIDDDCFVPTHAVRTLLEDVERGCDIASGIVWTKREPTEPCIYRRQGEGAYYNFPKNTVFEIEAAGMSCCMIKVDIFKQIEKPWFKFTWGQTNPKTGRYWARKGEDLYFCHKAREAGFKLHCDSRVLCDHLNVDTGKFYPGQKWVEKLMPPELQQKMGERVTKGSEPLLKSWEADFSE